MSDVSMLERMARRLCEAEPQVPGPDAEVIVGGKRMLSWEARLPAVRAILEAQWEPTDDMLQAGSKRILQRQIYAGTVDVGLAWQAMLEVAQLEASDAE